MLCCRNKFRSKSIAQSPKTDKDRNKNKDAKKEQKQEEKQETKNDQDKDGQAKTSDDNSEFDDIKIVRIVGAISSTLYLIATVLFFMSGMAYVRDSCGEGLPYRSPEYAVNFFAFCSVILLLWLRFNLSKHLKILNTQ